MRQSFKKQVGAINERGDFTRGLRRLRRLGILKDGGDAGASSDSGTSDGSEDEDEGEEGEEGEEDEDESGSDAGEEGEEDADDDAESDSAELEPAAAATARASMQNSPAARTKSREAVLPKSRHAATGRGELPFTYGAPATHAEFLGLVDERSATEMGAVIERICACNAIALAPDNRQKLQVFFGVLLVHFEALAQQTPPPQEHLDMLVYHLLVRLFVLRCVS